MIKSPITQYGRHLIDKADLDSVESVLLSDNLTSGPVTELFEKEFAESAGAKFAISCSSGTAALHLAALTIGLGPGDQVIVPTITFVATANVVRYVGADIVFADVDPDNGLMRPRDLLDALDRASNAKAVFPVYLAGQAPEMAEIYNISKQAGLFVVEDACHAPGTEYTYHGNITKAGGCQHADISTFSFHPVKTIAMGEGGMLTTNNEQFALSARQLRSHGITRNPEEMENQELAFDPSGSVNCWYYEARNLGFNYRASEIHCALGLSQLAKLKNRVINRRELMRAYCELLKGLSPTVKLTSRQVPDRCSWHLCIVLIDFVKLGKTRHAVMQELHAKGVGTQVHYIPVHKQPIYSSGLHTGLPGAEAFYERCLSLPLNPLMNKHDVGVVCETLHETIGVGS